MEQQTIEKITQMVLQTLNQMESKSNGFQVPVGVSARHIHLTQEHVEVQPPRPSLGTGCKEGSGRIG